MHRPIQDGKSDERFKAAQTCWRELLDRAFSFGFAPEDQFEKLVDHLGRAR